MSRTKSQNGLLLLAWLATIAGAAAIGYFAASPPTRETETEGYDRAWSRMNQHPPKPRAAADGIAGRAATCTPKDSASIEGIRWLRQDAGLLQPVPAGKIAVTAPAGEVGLIETVEFERAVRENGYRKATLFELRAEQAKSIPGQPWRSSCSWKYLTGASVKEIRAEIEGDGHDASKVCSIIFPSETGSDIITPNGDDIF